MNSMDLINGVVLEDFFSDCGNSNEADLILARLVDSLLEFTTHVFSSPKQYWDIPELFEFTFKLNPTTQKNLRK